jgi:hypothetical protein
MYPLNRLILIDPYKLGELVKIRLDGHTNLNGVNGVGKTTLLRLVPLFFGERPGRLVPKSRVTDSFSKHYLPNESSCHRCISDTIFISKFISNYPSHVAQSTYTTSGAF